MYQTSLNKSKISRRWKIALVSGAVIGVLSIIAVSVLYRIQFGGFLSPRMGDWGDFGTYFSGTVGPILGMLSLAGILMTVGLQWELVWETRRQIGIAESASEASRKEMEQQAALLRQQAFESTFFQLLRLREDMIESIHIPLPAQHTIGDHNITGRKAFEVIVKEYWDIEFMKCATLPPEQRVQVSYPKFLFLRGQAFLPYLRLTIALLDLIDVYGDLSDMEKLEESFAPDSGGICWSPIHNKNQAKQRYATIVLAPITYYELLMLALFAWSGGGSAHSAGLIERYGVLRNIPEYPPHLGITNEVENEQQVLYALRRLYRDIAFQTPGAKY